MMKSGENIAMELNLRKDFLCMNKKENNCFF